MSVSLNSVGKARHKRRAAILSLSSRPVPDSIAALIYVDPSNATVAHAVISLQDADSVQWTPVVTGGRPTFYSVSPTLPSGLVLNDTTGIISGSPSAPSESQPYVVTSTNELGYASFAFYLTVTPRTYAICGWLCSV